MLRNVMEGGTIMLILLDVLIAQERERERERRERRGERERE